MRKIEMEETEYMYKRVLTSSRTQKCTKE